jgi:hypothetical protein
LGGTQNGLETIQREDFEKGLSICDLWNLEIQGDRETFSEEILKRNFAMDLCTPAQNPNQLKNSGNSYKQFNMNAMSC